MAMAKPWYNKCFAFNGNVIGTSTLVVLLPEKTFEVLSLITAVETQFVTTLIKEELRCVRGRVADQDLFDPGPGPPVHHTPWTGPDQWTGLPHTPHCIYRKMCTM